jgi:hypothetical protein
VRTIHPADIVTALAHCDPRALADALATSPDPAFTALSDAVLAAAQHKAAYPRADVIAEADALLYDVLRWPIDDTLPEGTSIDPTTFARQRNIPLVEAHRIIGHLAATESYAVDQLLQSGVQPTYTLQQAQVFDCITTLRMNDRVPTRALVREHALRAARDAMRPGEDTPPIIYSPNSDLPPRIVSPSPKVHAVLWLDSMTADPPPVGILEERITYLQQASLTMGRCSTVAESLRHVQLPEDVPSTPTPRVVPSLRLAG